MKIYKLPSNSSPFKTLTYHDNAITLSSQHPRNSNYRILNFYHSHDTSEKILNIYNNKLYKIAQYKIDYCYYDKITNRDKNYFINKLKHSPAITKTYKVPVNIVDLGYISIVEHTNDLILNFMSKELWIILGPRIVIACSHDEDYSSSYPNCLFDFNLI